MKLLRGGLKELKLKRIPQEKRKKIILDRNRSTTLPKFTSDLQESSFAELTEVIRKRRSKPWLQ